jgi:para-nitrobenzyl esterase
MMKKTMLILLAVLISLTLASDAIAGSDCSEPVETTQGVITGFADEKHEACVYKGIPFAKPPMGDLRLKRPEPPEPHTGTFEALEFGPTCGQDEDCLYLNIYRPKKSGVFPVMFWIHGGGFTAGSGSVEFYDGSHLASRNDVVVVTINYRLNALGFLALPELKEEDPKGSTGNYGMLDQVRALEWNREHISAFGGDPDNVTVFGQSAGGMSICTLMVAPEAGGLFHRAMIMSAPCRLFTQLEAGYEKGRAAVKEIGCGKADDVLECLRSKPREALKLKGGNDMFMGGTAWSPTVDGSFMSGMPVELIKKGEYHKVPTIISTTRDELRLYTAGLSGINALPRSMINIFMKGLVGPHYKELMALYDYDDYRRPIDLALAFGNEMTFDTPLYMMAEAMSGQNPVYVYRFDWHHTRLPNKVGAFHAIDIPFIFGNFNADSELIKSLVKENTIEEDEYISLWMMDYITSFAKTGAPLSDEGPDWPAYTAESKNRLYVDREVKARELTSKEVARFEWFASRTMEDIMKGPISKITFTNKDRQ